MIDLEPLRPHGVDHPMPGCSVAVGWGGEVWPRRPGDWRASHRVPTGVDTAFDVASTAASSGHSDIDEQRRAEPARAAAWRSAVRAAMLPAMEDGLVATSTTATRSHLLEAP